jgi:hypothetical protein
VLDAKLVHDVVIKYPVHHECLITTVAFVLLGSQAGDSLGPTEEYGPGEV